MMRAGRFVLLAGLTLTLGACAVKAQARTEVEMPVLEPPPAPPRVVASYPAEPEVVPVAPAVEPVPPARAAVRTPRPEKPEPAQTPTQTVPEPVPEPPRASSLTLTPSPGTETQTAAAIRDLMTRAARDLSRVNQASLDADSRTQFETARRFLQQAEDALRANNVVSAGKLADKAATMAAVLVR